MRATRLNIWLVGYRIGRIPGNVMRWVVWKLPREMVLQCAIRVAAHATGGKWGNNNPSDVSIIQMMDRWGDPDAN
jgi:hypothetical protein